MTLILAAGDRFTTVDLFRDALRTQSPPGRDLQIQGLELPWPIEPFGSVDGVHEASGSPRDLAAHLDGVEICVTQLAPLTAEVLRGAPDLRMVSVCRGGPVNVDLDAATERGVLVTYAPARNAQAAAEFAITMMLAAMRDVARADADLKRDVWRGDLYALDRVGGELGGATVGLVGYGAIGRVVARVLRAFGADVLVADPYADPETAAQDGVRIVPLETLMRSSSVVSLHARLTPETHHLVDRGMLDLLPEGAVLVNTARGGLLDYAPLPDLLRSGRLGALALDVYDVEPPPADWPLLQAPNVTLTPHLGGATRQTAERAAAIVAADVHRYLDGEQPLHVANPDVLTRLAMGGAR